jgi:hypothetical protein
MTGRRIEVFVEDGEDKAWVQARPVSYNEGKWINARYDWRGKVYCEGFRNGRIRKPGSKLTLQDELSHGSSDAVEVASEGDDESAAGPAPKRARCVERAFDGLSSTRSSEGAAPALSSSSAESLMQSSLERHDLMNKDLLIASVDSEKEG